MLARLARLALSAASPAGVRGRLSVLMYHRILATPDPLLPFELDAAEFEATLKWVKQTFNVIPLEDGVRGLQDGKLPQRALCITFDDGYANNETIAAPILHRLGLHATFFIATGFLDGGRMFNDTVVEAVRANRGNELDLRSLGLGSYATASAQEKAKAISAILGAVKYEKRERREELVCRIGECVGANLPSNLMMSSQQVVNLTRAGFAIGGHTVNHPILAKLEAGESKREIEQGKRRLEEITGGRVRLFAYPNGQPHEDYSAATIELVRAAGFDGAVSTAAGAARVGSDVFQVPRFSPWRKGRMSFSAQMLANLTGTKEKALL